MILFSHVLSVIPLIQEKVLVRVVKIMLGVSCDGDTRGSVFVPHNEKVESYAAKRLKVGIHVEFGLVELLSFALCLILEYFDSSRRNNI